MDLQEVTHGGKATVLKLLEQLPEETTLEEIQYHLYVLQKIRAGQNAVDNGHVIPHEDLMRELAGWLASSGRLLRATISSRWCPLLLTSR